MVGDQTASGITPEVRKGDVLPDGHTGDQTGLATVFRHQVNPILDGVLGRVDVNPLVIAGIEERSMASRSAGIAASTCSRGVRLFLRDKDPPLC